MAYRVLSPSDLKKYGYKESEIDRRGGNIYLKSGVKPRGGVKEVKMATLNGPNGKTEIVEVGSRHASDLQSQGWGLTAGSYKAPAGTGSGTGTGTGSGSGSGTANADGTVDFKIPGTETVVKVPQSVIDNPIFKQLDANGQSLVAYQWNIYAGQNADQAKAFTEALAMASEQSGAYFGEQLNIAKDEISRAIGTIDTDTGRQISDLNAWKQYIEEKLASDKANMSIEEQAALKNQAMQYDAQIKSLGEQQAATGMSSSSIADKAKEQTLAQNEGVVTSTQRTTANGMADATAATRFDLSTIASQISGLNSGSLADKKDRVRQYEKLYGTDALKGLGFDSLLLGVETGSSITGSNADARASDIVTRAMGLATARGF